MRRPPSARQIEAAKMNGGKSKGPIDTSKTRFNALDHALYAFLSISHGKHLPEYPKYFSLLQVLLARLGAGSHLPENVLICEQLATELWRKSRLFGYELAELSKADALRSPVLSNAVRYLSLRDRTFAQALDRYREICPVAPLGPDSLSPNKETIPSAASGPADLPVPTDSPLDSAPGSVTDAVSDEMN